MTADNSSDQNSPQPMLQIMMAEYASLQAARSSTIFDASSRVNLYIGTISSVLVALGFIGQNGGDTTPAPFFVFALLLLPPVFVLGIATFERVLQISIQDVVYARGINRIRHYYTDVAPGTARYFIAPIHDDMKAVLEEFGTNRSPIQIFIATPGMVSGINSLLFGVIVGILTHVILTLGLLPCLAVGTLGFALSLMWHTRYQNRRWRESVDHIKSMFPSP